MTARRTHPPDVHIDLHHHLHLAHALLSVGRVWRIAGHDREELSVVIDVDCRSVEEIQGDGQSSRNIKES